MNSSQKTQLDMVPKLEYRQNIMLEIDLKARNQTFIINSNNPLKFGANLDYFDSLPLKIEKTDFGKIEAIWNQIEQKSTQI